MKNKKVEGKTGIPDIQSIDEFDISNFMVDDFSSANPDAEDLETQERKRYAQDTTYRKLLAKWVMWVVSVWLGIVITIVVLTGFRVLTYTPTVLVTLLATTTINVLGLAFIVLRGLFLGHGRFKRRRN